MSPVGVTLACTLAEIAELEALHAALEARGVSSALVRDELEIQLARLVARANDEWLELDEACRDQELFAKLLAALPGVH